MTLEEKKDILKYINTILDSRNITNAADIEEGRTLIRLQNLLPKLEKFLLRDTL